MVLKWAVPILKLAASDSWRRVEREATTERTAVIGHVRRATSAANMAHDDAAHPFRFGRTVGAHNGIIYNHRALAAKHNLGKLKVDSEAAIALLDRMPAAEALRQLDGYFALSWAQHGKVALLRSPEAPLAMAYVPEARMLVWCSEVDVLNRELEGRGMAGLVARELDAGTIYRFNPTAFTRKASRMKREKVDLSSRKHTTVHALHRDQMNTGSLDDIVRRLHALENRVVALEWENDYLRRLVERRHDPPPMARCEGCGTYDDDLTDTEHGWLCGTCW